MAPLNVGESGRTERTFALLVSGNYFSALGLRPAVGRFIRPDEADVAGAEPIVVLSHDYWQTRFGGNAAAIGQTLLVNDNQLTIVGVAPEAFQGTVMGLQFDLWVPATLAAVLVPGSTELESRNQRGYTAIGAPRATARRKQRRRRNSSRRWANWPPRSLKATAESAGSCGHSGRPRAGRR